MATLAWSSRWKPLLCGVRRNDQGQPFFVMEYVEGTPINDYCDKHRLTIEDRIGIFQQLCQGVQHAHQKGVLHRDLKPGNILVSRKDDQHTVKIIDFGLARATDHQLVDKTIYTEQGQLIGTPEFMSPEQASGSAPDIDTRTDIYSLGVLLYQLLSGELPFTSAELRAAGLLEMQRIIREQEPQKPSTKISSIGDAAADSAGRRKRWFFENQVITIRLAGFGVAARACRFAAECNAS